METKQLYTQLKWILIAFSSIAITNSILRTFDVRYDILSFILKTIHFFMLWWFVSRETNERKGATHGFITMTIAVIILMVFSKIFPKSYQTNMSIVRYVLGLGLFGLAFYLFAKQAFITKRKQLIFTLLTSIIYVGVNSLAYLHINTRFVKRLLRDIFNADWFDYGLISFKKGNNIIILDQYIYSFISNIVFFLFVIALFKHLKNDSLRKLVTNFRFNKLKVTVVFGAFYVFIFGYSFAIIDNISMLLRMDSSMNIYLKFIRNFFELCIGISTLCIIAFTFRKLLVEYYLSFNKAISWNYFFLQMPIIGIFVWIYNLITFKNPTILTTKNKKHIVNYTDNFGIIFLGLLFACIPLFRISDTYDLAIVIVSILFLMVYYGLKKGIYVHLGLHILVLLLLFTIEYFEIYKTPFQIIKSTYFLSIAYIIIQYPVFHITAYDIESIDTKET